MRHGAIYRDGEILLARAARTSNSLERMRGLLFSPAPAAQEALLITPCNAVHTALMRCALDVAFLDHDGRVRKLIAGLKPWSLAGCLVAGQTLEMAAGTAARLGLETGQQLEWREYRE